MKVYLVAALLAAVLTTIVPDGVSAASMRGYTTVSGGYGQLILPPTSND